MVFPRVGDCLQRNLRDRLLNSTCQLFVSLTSKPEQLVICSWCFFRIPAIRIHSPIFNLVLVCLSQTPRASRSYQTVKSLTLDCIQHQLGGYEQRMVFIYISLQPNWYVDISDFDFRGPIRKWSYIPVFTQSLQFTGRASTLSGDGSLWFKLSTWFRALLLFCQHSKVDTLEVGRKLLPAI